MHKWILYIISLMFVVSKRIEGQGQASIVVEWDGSIAFSVGVRSLFFVVAGPACEQG